MTSIFIYFVIVIKNYGISSGYKWDLFRGTKRRVYPKGIIDYQ